MEKGYRGASRFIKVLIKARRFRAGRMSRMSAWLSRGASRIFYAVAAWISILFVVKSC